MTAGNGGGVGNDVVDVKGGASSPIKTVEELCEVIGLSWYQWRLFFFVGLCVASDSIEVNLLSFLSVEATKEWELEEFWEDTVAAAVFMGEITGCFIFGLLADTYGRRPAFLLGTVFVSVFGLATAVAGSLRQLLVLRFLVGFGIGGFIVPFDLLAETCPPHLRGLVLCALWTFWTLGSVALNIVAASCLRDEDGPGHGRDPLGWRWLTFFAAIPPSASLMGISLVDESPAWLAARGRGEEAKHIILRAATVNGVDLDPNFEVAPEPENDAGVEQLFTDGNWFRTVCLWGLNYTSHFAYYGVVLFLPRILGASASDPYNFDALLLSCLGEVFGSLLACYFIQLLPRKTLLGCSLCVLSASIPVVLINGSPIWLLVAAALVARGSAMMASSLTWIVTPEGYPTEVRATGHSWGNLLARVGALLTTYWGRLDMPESLKVVSYVWVALLGLALAVALPEGVMGVGIAGGPESAECRGDEGEGRIGKDAAGGGDGGGGGGGESDGCRANETKHPSGKRGGYGAVSQVC